MFRVRHELTLNTPVIYSLENSLLELEINMFRVRQETIYWSPVVLPYYMHHTFVASIARMLLIPLDFIFLGETLTIIKPKVIYDDLFCPTESKSTETNIVLSILGTWINAFYYTINIDLCSIFSEYHALQSSCFRLSIG